MAVDDAATGGPPLAVVLLDLDRFKEVNDVLGHAVGDALLCAVAERLAGQLRCGDVLARLGGDEFVLLLRDADPAAVRCTADRLLVGLRQPFDVDGLVLEVDGSLGVATSGAEPEELLRAGDVAMYAAKADRSGVVVHSPQLDRHDPTRLSLFGDLRRGIRAGELRVHYQPKAALADGPGGRGGGAGAVGAPAAGAAPPVGVHRPGRGHGARAHPSPMSCSPGRSRTAAAGGPRVRRSPSR